MPALAPFAHDELSLRDPDGRVFLHDVTWDQYETLLAIRGEAAGVRITYLAGELELMSPSRHHEAYKTLIARLLEAYAEERGVDLNGYGSWTVKARAEQRGVEPDECYVLGSHPPERPDLAIEVIWTSGGIGKLEVYRGLGVREVWLWHKGAIEVHALRVAEASGQSRYQRVEQSELLPELDLAGLVGYLDRPSQTEAVREYRAALRASRE